LDDFEQVNQQYEKIADIYFLCFALNDRNSFSNVVKYVRQLNSIPNLKLDEKVVFLIGTKSDCHAENNENVDQIIKKTLQQNIMRIPSVNTGQYVQGPLSARPHMMHSGSGNKLDDSGMNGQSRQGPKKLPTVPKESTGAQASVMQATSRKRSASCSNSNFSKEPLTTRPPHPNITFEGKPRMNGIVSAVPTQNAPEVRVPIIPIQSNKKFSYEVKSEEIQTFLSKYPIISGYLECSSKENTNINEVFSQALKAYYKRVNMDKLRKDEQCLLM